MFKKNINKTINVYGQHFLINKQVRNKIILSGNLKPKDIVLEIGPGKGFLTQALLNSDIKKLISVEVDEALFLLLKSRFSDNSKPHFELINNNIFSVINKLNFNKIVANIPYDITEGLIKRILIIQPEVCVLMISKRSLNFIRSYVLLSQLYDWSIVLEVSRKDFEPIPRTDSVVIKLNLKNDPVKKIFSFLLKHKNMLVKNALIKVLNRKLTKNEVRQIIKGVDLNKKIFELNQNEIEFIKEEFSVYF